ncbi:hypothetical protein BD626DRAFT_505317 [Schizophyllum amplum]|uniref:Uncharacterized protein n=1 Tax=Schizophyllum amplum TaxID=97359 RepID=A0A550C6K0_9AGAR|nr:hypothetical protein BD626DRAFT_505317 [Auriculariopsis ampla]
MHQWLSTSLCWHRAVNSSTIFSRCEFCLHQRMLRRRRPQSWDAAQNPSNVDSHLPVDSHPHVDDSHPLHGSHPLEDNHPLDNSYTSL